MTMPAPHRATGLTGAEVEAARRRHGPNDLPKPPRETALAVFLRQFSGLLVVILIVAALLAALLGERIDAIAIGLIVILNAVLGFVQEWRAERALEALETMMTPTALVRRDGVERLIPARDLVPGDIVLLSAGDGIPADIRILRSDELRVDESIVTGESLPVEKTVEESPDLLMGTAVTAGHAEGVVERTGAETSFGQIARMTGSVGTKVTDLQKKLGRLAGQLGIAALGLGAMIFLLGVWGGRPVFDMFMTGLSLAVAIVPEGLPAVVTITLALGASAMVRKQALARRLQAVETMGAASVICTDKTGTLTENKMTATRIWTPDRGYDVTGTGYDPAGHIETGGERLRADDDPVLAALLTTGLTCTHARVDRDATGWRMTGAPTEAALVTLAMKGWCPAVAPEARIAECPFSSERKRMSVLATSPDGPRLHVKGAPERIVEISDRILTKDGPVSLTSDHVAAITAANEALGSAGLRVIALASRPASAGDLDESRLVFEGLVGLIDPPRPEVREAIALARSAGIRVVMITGDSPITAAAIARDLGLHADPTVTGDELADMSDADLAAALRQDALFARTMPADKMRIVSALQTAGEIVAMTGDGVNDAPALKKADIGVAMGIRGTDVSKNAADLVLLDDNFATIVAAIGEGRRQFANVRKFVRYLLSSNAGEVIAIAVNLVLGGPLIFLATQILWMNLVTDSVTAVSLGLEKSEPGQMREPPRGRKAGILGGKGFLTILAFGTYTGAASLWLFYSLLPLGVDVARTTAFTGMVVFEKLSVFAFRSLSQPCFRIGWVSNPLLIGALTVTLSLQVLAIYWPPLQALLRTTAIGWSEWSLVIALALPLVAVPEAVKLLRQGRT